MVARLNELGAARRTRLLSAQASVPQLLWLLLVGGAAVVLVLSYFLPHGSGRGSKLALSATSCVIALTLFLIFVMDHPYTGNLRVDPTPLTDLLPRTQQTSPPMSALCLTVKLQTSAPHSIRSVGGGPNQQFDSSFSA
jgi:hypothetical protein